MPFPLDRFEALPPDRQAVVLHLLEVAARPDLDRPFQFIAAELRELLRDEERPRPE